VYSPSEEIKHKKYVHIGRAEIEKRAEFRKGREYSGLRKEELELELS
jgi:hypothetical protein